MVILLLIAPLTLNLPVLLYIHPTARLYRLIPISHDAPTGPVLGAPPPSHSHSHSRSPSVSLARSVPCKTAGTKWRRSQWDDGEQKTRAKRSTLRLVTQRSISNPLNGHYPTPHPVPPPTDPHVLALTTNGFPW